MIITTNMVIFVLVFIIGVVIGVYIMTQIESKAKRELIDQLLELEDDMSELRSLKDAYKNNQCKCKTKKT